MVLIRKSETAIEPQKNEEPQTLLGPQASFEGKLFYSGTLRIDGKFVGEIESDGTLVLGKGATVKGTIKVSCLKVEGSLDGNVYVKEKAEFLSKAKFVGEIVTKSLIVEEGVVFEGQCRMDSKVKTKEKSTTVADKKEQTKQLEAMA